MIIIGVDYHPSFQQIAFLDQETGECGEQRLNHSDGEAERYYRDLKQKGVSVRVGLEASGYSRWFERLLAELGFEVWIGDAAEIKRQRVRKQKTPASFEMRVNHAPACSARADHTMASGRKGANKNN